MLSEFSRDFPLAHWPASGLPPRHQGERVVESRCRAPDVSEAWQPRAAPDRIASSAPSLVHVFEEFEFGHSVKLPLNRQVVFETQLEALWQCHVEEFSQNLRTCTRPKFDISNRRTMFPAACQSSFMLARILDHKVSHIDELRSWNARQQRSGRMLIV